MKTSRITVRTTVTIPELDAAGMLERGRGYIALDDLAAWLDATADAFDKAHAIADIGGAIRACATAAREARSV